MRTNFDGARINLARSFNNLCRAMKRETGHTFIEDAYADDMSNLRCSIGAFLAMYSDDPKDEISMLADSVKLDSVYEEDEEE